jgi:hypothetical protein
MTLKFMRLRWTGQITDIGKYLKKCPLRRPRKIWEDNIKIDLREMSCEG